jgi:myo-inositol-1(or 4)-monophosphatase
MSTPLRLGPPPEDAAALLATAEHAARAAGALLLERFTAGADAIGLVSAKSTSTDLVSEADMAAEAAIRAILAQERPEDAVMGEEGADTPGTSGRRWIVDPLDGTINFLFGIPQWAVSVACDGVAGVVLDPCRGELFVFDGERATVNGEALRGSTCDELGEALVATGFGYEARVREGQAEVVARVLPRVRDIRRAGAAALDLAWAAAGRLDAFYERGVKPWDIAAGTLLCEAAGLVVRELEPTDALPRGVIAAPPGLIDELFALVA